VGGLFSLETISFVAQELFSFRKSHLSILSLTCWTYGVYWGNPCLYLLLPECFLLFPVPTSEIGVWY
jgi:hypothetical protein